MFNEAIAGDGAMVMKNGNKDDTSGDLHPGATASFPYDRMTVERFRTAFPKARWSDDLKAWFVPGKTAAKRFDRWLAQESPQADIYADRKGRDAYAFDPIVSKYLRLREDRMEVVTPYSRTIIERMREVPFASWDVDRRVWTVPYRSYEQLRRLWSQIEEAAKRNEPEERKKRRIENRGSDKERAARARAAERRRRRYPLDPENLPPFGRPVMTSEYGIVVFVDCDGEPVNPATLRSSYSDVPVASDYVWGRWRPPTLDELVKTWPLRPGAAIERRIWWQPTLDELRVARKAAACRERKRASSAD
ncbi:hypothetical protein [Mesorhizobium escarrei]|uniref:hypothetical protein n=1 Tax=Mesorhizobium escarrei TaxID=666018 RepID=UPI0020A80529|nr:hypothetical protein [Mesorhizobium escarrei]